MNQPQALVQALEAQRNHAMNQLAEAHAALAVLEAERQRLAARVAELEAPPPDTAAAESTEAR